jgi:hypothetical protein
MSVGTMGAQSGNFFAVHGEFKDVRVYHKGMSPHEVRELYFRPEDLYFKIGIPMFIDNEGAPTPSSKRFLPLLGVGT